MLAMQAQPVLQGVEAAAAHPQQLSSSQPAVPAAAAAAATAAIAPAGTGPPGSVSPGSTAAAEAKPLILLLDVHLDAPVLLMPLNSYSDDHLEVDLGTLQLSNTVVWQMTTGQDRQKLLMDEMQVGLCVGDFAGISCQICGAALLAIHITSAAVACACQLCTKQEPPVFDVVLPLLVVVLSC